MIKEDVKMDLFGLHFVIDVEYDEEEYPKVEACGVERVRALMANGVPVALKCDTERFWKDWAGDIQEALENAVADDRIAAYEARYEQEKEDK